MLLAKSTSPYIHRHCRITWAPKTTWGTKWWGSRCAAYSRSHTSYHVFHYSLIRYLTKSNGHCSVSWDATWNWPIVFDLEFCLSIQLFKETNIKSVLSLQRTSGCTYYFMFMTSLCLPLKEFRTKQLRESVNFAKATMKRMNTEYASFCEVNNLNRHFLYITLMLFIYRIPKFRITF